MITWTQFEHERPALAAAGRAQLYQIHIGLAFLATVRLDGGPRVHPVCPVLSADGLHVLIVAGPKQADLRRDGRYALHSETCPPPREDDGFAATSRTDHPGHTVGSAHSWSRRSLSSAMNASCWGANRPRTSIGGPSQDTSVTVSP
jgi:hypothetical protein